MWGYCHWYWYIPIDQRAIISGDRIEQCPEFLRDNRDERFLVGITELAAAVGVSFNTAWKWEHAKGRPSSLHRRKLAEIFGKETRDIAEAVRATAKEAEKEQAAA